MRSSSAKSDAADESQRKGRQGRLFGGNRKQRLNDDDDDAGGELDGAASSGHETKKAGTSRLSAMMPTRSRKASSGGPARTDSFPAPGSGHPSGGPIPSLGGGPMPAVTSSLPGAFGAQHHSTGMSAAEQAARDRERQEQEELELAMAMSMSIEEDRRNSERHNSHEANPAAPTDLSQEDADLRRALELSARESASMGSAPAAPQQNLVDFGEPLATSPPQATAAPADPFAPPSTPAGSAFASLVGTPPSAGANRQPIAAAAPENPFVAPSQPVQPQPAAAVSGFGGGFDGYGMNYAAQPPAYVQPGAAVIGQPVMPAVTGWPTQQQQPVHALPVAQPMMGAQPAQGMAAAMGQGMTPHPQLATGARAPRVPGATGAADPFAGLVQSPQGGSSVL